MSDAADRTDEELARAAKRGDDDAFDRLARRYLRPAVALAWQFARGLDDAEDIVQDAFHRVVRALGDYDDRRPFAPWFYSIVRNVARTAIRKDSRRAALAPLSVVEDEPPAGRDFDPVVAGDVERLIESLPPMQQACVRLCDIEGFSSVEAAAMLDLHEGTVRTHVHRARGRIQSAMQADRGILR